MPKAPLSRDRIVDAAIALADRDGFDAVTLRKLASLLGVHVTSLYNHVPTYDAVVDAVVERLLVEAKLPAVASSWKVWVGDFVNAFATIARTHPGAFAAFEHRPVQGPIASRTFEVALTAFAAAGLSTADSYAAIKTVALAAAGLGLEAAGLARGELPETDLDALPPADFPRMHKLAQEIDEVDIAGFLTESLIHGLAAMVRRRGTRRTSS